MTDDRRRRMTAPYVWPHCDVVPFAQENLYIKFIMIKQIYYGWIVFEKSFSNCLPLCDLERYSKSYIIFTQLGADNINHQS